MGGALQDRLGEPHLLRVIVSRRKVLAGGKRFGFLLDAGHHSDRIHRVLSYRCFSRQHAGVSTIEDGI